MKKLFILCLSMMMLVTPASADSEKTTNLLIGFTPVLGRMKGSIKYDAKNSPTDRFQYNKELGVTIGIERVINGFVVLPEFRYFRGNLKKTEYNSFGAGLPYPFPYTTFEDVNEFGYMQWVGFTINSKKRFQVPIMGGIGLDYVKGAPFNNMFFDYGLKIRMKLYFTPKFGMFLGGFYEGGSSWSHRGIPKGADSDDKFILHKSNLGSEVGFTITL